MRLDGPIVDAAWAGRGIEDGTASESGDLHVVEAFEGGVLIAVIDGLGHGAEAALAARRAAAELRAHAGRPVAELVERCHGSVRGTRGVVMSIASIDAPRSVLTWTGVGNVEAMVLRAGTHERGSKEVLVPRGGIVGHQLPALRTSEVLMSRGDLLVMATDGIRSAFTAALDVRQAPREAADAILAHYARERDDALVLLARYLGSQP